MYHVCAIGRILKESSNDHTFIENIIYERKYEPADSTLTLWLVGSILSVFIITYISLSFFFIKNGRYRVF